MTITPTLIRRYLKVIGISTYFLETNILDLSPTPMQIILFLAIVIMSRIIRI